MSVTSALPTALAIVNGVVRLGRKIDQISAEKLVGKAPLALAIPEYVGQEISNDDLWTVFANLLEAEAVKLTSEESKLLEANIKALDNHKGSKVNRKALEDYEGIFKIHAIAANIDWKREKTFREKVIADNPAWRMEKEEILAIQYIKATGGGFQSKAQKTTWRLARVLLDLFADFGAAQTGLIVKDEKWRPVIGAILTKFGGANIGDEDFSPGDVMRLAFSSTVSGILDARESLDIDSKWLASFLDSLAGLQDEMDGGAEKGFDSFVLGLFQNKGYPKLVSAILDASAAGLKDKSGADKIVSQYLGKVSEMLKDADGTVSDFLKARWPDLLRGVFKSLSENADLIVSPEDSGLANTVLKEVLQGFAENKNLSSIVRDPGEFLTVIAQEAVSAVAANKNLLEGEIGRPWLRELVGQAADLINNQGVRNVLSLKGVSSLVKDVIHETAGVIAKNPTLLGDEIGEKWLRQLAPALVETLTDDVVIKKWSQGDLKGLITEVADTAVKTFAAAPSLLNSDINQDWLKDMISGGLDLAAKNGVAKLFTPAGSKRLFNAVLKKGAEAVVANPEILKLKEPWLQNLAKQVAQAVSKSGTMLFASPDRLADLGVDLVDAAIDAAIEDPSLLTDQVKSKRLGSFLQKFLKGVADNSVKDYLGKDGPRVLLGMASGVIAGKPEIILSDDATKAMSKMTAGVLGAFSKGVTKRANGLKMTEAMLASALEVLGEHPELVSKDLPEIVSSLALTLATSVEEHGFKPALAQKLAGEFPDLLLENALFYFSKHRTIPGELTGMLFAARRVLIEKESVGGVASAVLDRVMSELVKEALTGLAAIAKGKLELLTAPKALALVRSELDPLINTGLEKLLARIGDGLSASQLPLVLKGLILDWGKAATGEVIDINALIDQRISKMAA